MSILKLILIGRVDALKVCLEEELEKSKHLEELSMKKENEKNELKSSNSKKSEDIDASLSPFVIAPQRRRHSLWMPSPLNSMSFVEPGIVSYDPSKDKVMQFISGNFNSRYYVDTIIFSNQNLYSIGKFRQIRG